jgi:hypothetical protein
VARCFRGSIECGDAAEDVLEWRPLSRPVLLPVRCVALYASLVEAEDGVP